MNYIAVQQPVFNRGAAPLAFLEEVVAWAKTAPDEIFAPNKANDIFTQVFPELGPYLSLVHRRAVMVEVLRVLAGFESGWKWGAGIDSTRASSDTSMNSEAGAWQVSYDSRGFGDDLVELLRRAGILHGVEFQQAMKERHTLAMEYVARLMRHTTKHNGPLYKNRSIFPHHLQGREQSIYPWLRQTAVAEFMEALSK